MLNKNHGCSLQAADDAVGIESSNNESKSILERLKEHLEYTSSSACSTALYSNADVSFNETVIDKEMDYFRTTKKLDTLENICYFQHHTSNVSGSRKIFFCMLNILYENSQSFK